MPFQKRYEYYEVRDLLKLAEGVDSPLTNAPAHSRTLHATAAGGTEGATAANMLNRVTRQVGESGNAFRRRGGVSTTGAFATRLLQGSAACEALNSTAGQAAMAVFDDPTNAALNLRLELTVPITREQGFLPASGAPSFSSVRQGDAAVTQTQATCGIKMIIDRATGATVLHIQTCYPIGGVVSAAAWEIKNMATRAVVAAG